MLASQPIRSPRALSGPAAAVGADCAGADADGSGLRRYRRDCQPRKNRRFEKSIIRIKSKNMAIGMKGKQMAIRIKGNKMATMSEEILQ
jgi:hypothetical protein